MSPELHLLVHNILTAISGLTAISLGVFILWKNPKKLANIVLSLMNFSVAVFMVSHLFGTNTIDSVLSTKILMFNISIIYIVIFTVHITYIVYGMNHKRRYFIAFVYISGIVLSFIYMLHPDTFILQSVPKLYFPNYYVPGHYQWIMRVVFDIIFPVYLVIESIVAYRSTTDPILKNRIKYWLTTISIGYAIGSIPILLVYNIQVDPAYGVWFVPIYSLPLVYAIINYELVDVRVIAKKAFFYGIAIAAVGGFISVVNLLSQFITNNNPKFPFWVMPMISAVIAVFIGISVWKKLRETDLLKYEFITTATHKFRTPLTHIKWASENLAKINLPGEAIDQVSYIQAANAKLVELTNILVNVSEAEDMSYQYKISRNDLSTITREVIASIMNQILLKKIDLAKNINRDVFIMCDASRLAFVIQTLIENSIQYTKDHGSISVNVYAQGKFAIFSVSDSGIGISKEELPLLFSKFYRGSDARNADTEGMGIGLYVSKEIITKLRGKIWAESKGAGKGSTFYFALPLAK